MTRTELAEAQREVINGLNAQGICAMPAKVNAKTATVEVWDESRPRQLAYVVTITAPAHPTILGPGRLMPGERRRRLPATDKG